MRGVVARALAASVAGVLAVGCGGGPSKVTGAAGADGAAGGGDASAGAGGGASAGAGGGAGAGAGGAAGAGAGGGAGERGADAAVDAPGPTDGAPAEAVVAAPFSACALSFPYQDEPTLGTWLGADSAYSLPLSPTTALWSFQDTFVGKHGQTARAGSALIANSFALVTCQAGVASIRYFWGQSGGAPRAILADGVANQRFWPQQPFLHQGTLFAAMTRVQGGADEIGTTLARVANPTAPPDQWTAEYFELTTLPGLGKGTILVDGYAYLFGNAGTAIVARLPLDALVARTAEPKALLQYLAKNGQWKPGLVATDAKQLGFAANVGTSFRYLPKTGRWLVLFLTTSGWPSRDIAISTAPSLEGPWTPAVTVYQVPEMIPGRPEYEVDNVCYAAIEHPESNPAPERDLYFSYTCNSFVFAKQLANLGIYLPKLVRVANPAAN